MVTFYTQFIHQVQSLVKDAFVGKELGTLKHCLDMKGGGERRIHNCMVSSKVMTRIYKDSENC